MTATNTPAADCQTMQQVRAEIDRIDRILVALVAERQGYMDAAARIKPSLAAVRDEARIVDVMDKVLAAATVQGLSPAIAGPVWQVMIDRCIAYENRRFKALRETAEAASAAV
ncbi:MAG: chorismate mutase [Hyphomonadaceae bacterium]|jgi:isochorismate pyruvate lyase|nr:chorismate mutase [Hyphomonadaceae bacterium]